MIKLVKLVRAERLLRIHLVHLVMYFELHMFVQIISSHFRTCGENQTVNLSTEYIFEINWFSINFYKKILKFNNIIMILSQFFRNGFMNLHT